MRRLSGDSRDGTSARASFHDRVQRSPRDLAFLTRAATALAFFARALRWLADIFAAAFLPPALPPIRPPLAPCSLKNLSTRVASMGSLYRRGKVWWLKYYQNGRSVRESSGSEKEPVARRVLRDREGDVVKGIPIIPKAGRVTFDEAADDLDRDYSTNNTRSLVTVRRNVQKHLRPYFKNRRMAEIRTDAIRTYISQRQTEGASNATISRELAALKRLFTFAIQAGKLHSKPHIPMLREGGPEPCAGRRPGENRNAADRPQDTSGVRPVRYRGRERSSGRNRQAQYPDGHTFGHN
jgi:Phage integrase, N-terminal SAM-like domain